MGAPGAPGGAGLAGPAATAPQLGQASADADTEAPHLGHLTGPPEAAAAGLKHMVNLLANVVSSRPPVEPEARIRGRSSYWAATSA